MMKDIFAKKAGFENEYFVDPFNVRVQLSFRNTYDPDNDEYKYRIGVLADKVKINLNPASL